MEQQLESLKAQRTALKSNVTSAHNRLKSAIKRNRDETEVNALLDILESKFENFNAIHTQYSELIATDQSKFGPFATVGGLDLDSYYQEVKTAYEQGNTAVVEFERSLAERQFVFLDHDAKRLMNKAEFLLKQLDDFRGNAIQGKIIFDAVEQAVTEFRAITQKLRLINTSTETLHSSIDRCVARLDQGVLKAKQLPLMPNEPVQTADSNNERSHASNSIIPTSVESDNTTLLTVAPPASSLPQSNTPTDRPNHTSSTNGNQEPAVLDQSAGVGAMAHNGDEQQVNELVNFLGDTTNNMINSQANSTTTSRDRASEAVLLPGYMTNTAVNAQVNSATAPRDHASEAVLLPGYMTNTAVNAQANSATAPRDRASEVALLPGYLINTAVNAQANSATAPRDRASEVALLPGYLTNTAVNAQANSATAPRDHASEAVLLPGYMTNTAVNAQANSATAPRDLARRPMSTSSTSRLPSVLENVNLINSFSGNNQLSTGSVQFNSTPAAVASNVGSALRPLDLSITAAYKENNPAMFSHPDRRQGSGSSSGRDSRFKKADLPTFDGNRRQWYEFRALWRSYGNTEFSSEEDRAWEFKRCLQGKALEYVKAILVNQPNAYERIWHRLEGIIRISA